jgi:hypothetical protein
MTLGAAESRGQIFVSLNANEVGDGAPPGHGGSGAQGVDQLIQVVRQRRVHVSLNYQPSTLNHSGGLFSVAPVLRPPARRHNPRKGPRPHHLNDRPHCRRTTDVQNVS